MCLECVSSMQLAAAARPVARLELISKFDDVVLRDTLRTIFTAGSPSRALRVIVLPLLLFTAMYEFINFSRDVAATPFQRNGLSCLQRFAHDEG